MPTGYAHTNKNMYLCTRCYEIAAHLIQTYKNKN